LKSGRGARRDSRKKVFASMQLTVWGMMWATNGVEEYEQ
jgi:hypothetical protein